MATYGQIARMIGRPRAARVVGYALSAAPADVPCHRVVGKDMSVTGYGGGYAAKKFLLALELGVTVDALPFKNSVHPKGKI